MSVFQPKSHNSTSKDALSATSPMPNWMKGGKSQQGGSNEDTLTALLNQITISKDQAGGRRKSKKGSKKSSKKSSKKNSKKGSKKGKKSSKKQRGGADDDDFDFLQNEAMIANGQAGGKRKSVKGSKKNSKKTKKSSKKSKKASKKSNKSSKKQHGGDDNDDMEFLQNEVNIANGQAGGKRKSKKSSKKSKKQHGGNDESKDAELEDEEQVGGKHMAALLAGGRNLPPALAKRQEFIKMVGEKLGVKGGTVLISYSYKFLNKAKDEVGDKDLDALVDRAKELFAKESNPMAGFKAVEEKQKAAREAKKALKSASQGRPASMKREKNSSSSSANSSSSSIDSSSSSASSSSDL